ncbi:MAG: tRNA epoxyqueuosine(34) reductase QueG [Bacteroidia bacterium]
MPQSHLAHLLREKALQLGFLDCRFAQARALEEERDHFDSYLQSQFHGEMGYLERNIEKRLDPRELVPGAQTVISLAYNYFPAQAQAPETPKIARYAYGEDYHKVVKDQAYQLFHFLQTLDPNCQGRVFVDSAPVMERQWAALSGLGWIGKNSLLLRKAEGSYFFLAEIICSTALPADAPVTDHCGSCTACIDACPTQAIVQAGVIDSRACISYLSIERQSSLTEAELGQLNGWAFGCDICQEVCPWNRFAKAHAEPRFETRQEWPDWSPENWKTLDQNQWEEAFGNSPMTRAGWEKFKAQTERALRYWEDKGKDT